MSKSCFLFQRADLGLAYMLLEAYVVNIILKNYLHVKGYPVMIRILRIPVSVQSAKCENGLANGCLLNGRFFSLWLVMRPLFNKDKWVTMSLLQRPCSGSPGDDEDECVTRHELGVLQL